MVKAKHWNMAQQRVLRTLLALAEHGATGLTTGKIAKLVGTIPSNATRDLANLRIAGLARHADDRWYPARLLVPYSNSGSAAEPLEASL